MPRVSASEMGDEMIRVPRPRLFGFSVSRLSQGAIVFWCLSQHLFLQVTLYLT